VSTAAYDQADAAIAQTAAGSTTVFPGVANRRIRVLSYLIMLDAAGTAKWVSGSTDKTGALPVGGSSGVAEATGNVDIPLFECGVGEALILTTVTGLAQGRVRIEYR
jgi:hypothetical protein